MYWVSHNGQRVANQYVDVYTIGPPRWSNSYEPTLGGTLYFNEAYPAGYRLNLALTPSSNGAAASAAVCAHDCILTESKDTLAGFEYNPSTQACACTITDPIAMSTHSSIISDGSAFVTYTTLWCQGARPSSNDGAYTYSYQYNRWCPGRVATALGEAVLSGEVHPSHQSVAATCQASCATDTDCNLLEVLGTSWTDIIGTEIQWPHPPPSPPLPPGHPPPLHPPLPPNFPIRAAGDRLRSWAPVDNALPVQDDDGLYTLSCGAPISCGIIPLPIFRGDFLSVVELSREMQRDYNYDATRCPWEWYVYLLSNPTP
jgi:hypothetical protein